MGNRLSSLSVPSYSYNSSNELSSNSNGSFTYDANGNTLSDASGKQYTWDFENRLTQTVVPGANGGTTTFRYDPFGRRIQKSGPLGTTNYLYDGPNLTEEADSAGNVLARYTQGPRIDQPLSELRGSSASYYQQDGLSTVTSLSNSAGALSQSYTYDSHGTVTASSGTITNPFQYTGREFDQETGIYYYRARYYDAMAGRFVSEDPIRFLGGINFYSYVRNASPNLRDPGGLCDEPVDVCHAQLSGRLGAVGGQFKIPHLWWWISIGEQDYIISGTGTEWNLEGPALNIHVTKGRQSSSNPDDYVGNPNSYVLFDTRDAHGGFASPEDCLRVQAMLDRALAYPNGMIPYDYDYSSNAAAYYVGWPYHNDINNVVAPGWRYPLGWGEFLPWVDYPDLP